MPTNMSTSTSANSTDAAFDPTAKHRRHGKNKGDFNFEDDEN